MAQSSTVAYLLSSPYSPADEFVINPLDPELGIAWGVDVADMKLSEKDSVAPSLKKRLGEGKFPG